MEANAALRELLEGLPEPRDATGNRHPLPARRAWAVVARRAGLTSAAAVVASGPQRGGAFLRLRGCTRRSGLGKATSSRVCLRSAVADVEARSRQGIPGRRGAEDTPHRARDDREQPARRPGGNVR